MTERLHIQCTLPKCVSDNALALGLRRHELPRVPADLGLSAEQFAEAVVLAPSTRPDRYTILEHLDLDPAAVRDRVDAFVESYGG